MERMEIKILGVSCAYKKEGETAWLVQYALNAAEELGKRIRKTGNIQTEFVDLGDKELNPFLAYYQWHQSKGALDQKTIGAPGNYGCVEENDYMEDLWAKLAEADGFIFGSPVSVGTASSKFNILCERLTARVQNGHLTSKPAGLIAVGHASIGGQESCLRHMANCIRELEMIEVSWMLGVPAAIGSDGVKKDEHAKRFAVYTARRVVEFSMMQKLAKQELGELYTKEFIQGYHDAQREEPWFWDELDKEDDDFFMSLEGSRKGEKAWISAR